MGVGTMQVKTIGEIKKIIATDKKQTHSCGDNLYLITRSKKDGGGKSFVGRMYHPTTKKKVEKTIGKPFNTQDETVMTIQAAKTKWLQIKQEAKANNCHPNKLKPLIKLKTLNDVKDELFAIQKTKIKPTTLREYQRQYRYNILSNLDGDIPIQNYDTDYGMDLIEDALLKIRGGHEGIKFELERKCRGLLARTFRYAQQKRWIRGLPVVTNRDMLPSHTPTHHPKLDWEDVPAFLDVLETYSFGQPPQQVLCTKFILLTALRTGTATRIKWKWIDYKNGWIRIPASTSGLKRVKGKNDHRDHFIPLTKDINKLLNTAKKYSLSSEYVFAPIKASRYPHLDPEAPNNLLRTLGIKNREGRMVVMHGWRGTFMTEGLNMGGSLEIIKKIMGHLPQGKVNNAYDTSECLPQRKKFLEKWSKALKEAGLKL